MDVNPLWRHSGWKCGKIQHLDEESGQIEVVYESEDKQYLYWTHLDNEAEIAENGTICIGLIVDDILQKMNIGDVHEMEENNRNGDLANVQMDGYSQNQIIHIGEDEDRLTDFEENKVYSDDRRPFEEKNQENEVVIWIRDTLKMPQYLEVFEAEGFDQLDMMRELTEIHLKELGINKMGHRLKILKAIRELNEEGGGNDLNHFDEQAEGDLATNHMSQ